MNKVIGNVNATKDGVGADGIQPANSSDFREDVKFSDHIATADVSIGRRQTLTAFPWEMGGER
jgi:hypothetical protein